MFDVSMFVTHGENFKVEFEFPVESELFYKYLGIDAQTIGKIKTFLIGLDQETIETAIESLLFEIMEDGSNEVRILTSFENKWKQVYWTSI